VKEKLMNTTPTIIPGVVRGGLIVPEGAPSLPEGTRVTIVVPADQIPEELRDEFAAWERAGDEAWAWIDEFERREGQ
jgi:hypothetical protein